MLFLLETILEKEKKRGGEGSLQAEDFREDDMGEVESKIRLWGLSRG